MTHFPINQKINVPYPWESQLSGIGDTEYRGQAWYQKEGEQMEKIKATAKKEEKIVVSYGVKEGAENKTVFECTVRCMGDTWLGRQ